jgi:hypothetical protein
MAEGGGPSNGGHQATPGGSERGKANTVKRTYVREHTVRVDVEDNKRTKADSVIGAIEQKLGADAVFACVPKSGNIFEVTTADLISAELLLDGVEIDGRIFECSEVEQKGNKPIVVSLMYLPAYMEDDVIEAKIKEFDTDIEFVGHIRRHFYRGTTIADGTRIVTLRLPPGLKSLPYTMKFPYGNSNDYYRVIHDNQVKLCRVCNSDSHLMLNCPDFRCHRCNGQGHLKRQCEALPCTRCRRYGLKCVCVPCGKCNAIECVCDEYSDTTCDNCWEIVCVCNKDSGEQFCTHKEGKCDCKWTCDLCGRTDETCDCVYTDVEDEEMIDVVDRDIQLVPLPNPPLADTSEAGQTAKRGVRRTDEPVVTSQSRNGSKPQQGSETTSTATKRKADQLINSDHDTNQRVSDSSGTPGVDRDATSEHETIQSQINSSQSGARNKVRRNRLVNNDSVNISASRSQRKKTPPELLNQLQLIDKHQYLC